MGRRGRQLILKSFNWERETLSLLQLYDRILKGGGAVGGQAISSAKRAQP